MRNILLLSACSKRSWKYPIFLSIIKAENSSRELTYNCRCTSSLVLLHRFSSLRLLSRGASAISASYQRWKCCFECVHCATERVYRDTSLSCCYTSPPVLLPLIFTTRCPIYTNRLYFTSECNVVSVAEIPFCSHRHHKRSCQGTDCNFNSMVI